MRETGQPMFLAADGRRLFCDPFGWLEAALAALAPPERRSARSPWSSAWWPGWLALAPRPEAADSGLRRRPRARGRSDEKVTWRATAVQNPGQSSTHGGVSMATPKLTTARQRALAVAAGVDPRTVARAYAASLDPAVPPPRGMAGDRAVRALIEAGLLPAPLTAA